MRTDRSEFPEEPSSRFSASCRACTHGEPFGHDVVRLLVWLDIGMLIYWFYGRTHSPLADPREAAARTTGETVGNTLKIAGYLLLFNGAAITLLAFLTEWNVTNEALARWSELDAITSRGHSCHTRNRRPIRPEHHVDRSRRRSLDSWLHERRADRRHRPSSPQRSRRARRPKAVIPY